MNILGNRFDISKIIVIIGILPEVPDQQDNPQFAANNNNNNNKNNPYLITIKFHSRADKKNDLMQIHFLDSFHFFILTKIFTNRL